MRIRDNLQYGIVMPIDLSELLKTNCEKSDLAFLESPCLNGKKLKYVRKQKATYCLLNTKLKDTHNKIMDCITK